MPGNVPLAAATAVLPASLCRAFSASREYPVQVNEFPDGSAPREIEATNSRRSWKLTRALRPTDLVTLRDFYDARKGPHEPFFLYDPFEVGEGNAIGSNYDATGVSLEGRFTVRFRTQWQQQTGLTFSEVGMELIELAQSIDGAEELSFDQTQSSGQVAAAGF